MLIYKLISFLITVNIIFFYGYFSWISSSQETAAQDGGAGQDQIPESCQPNPKETAVQAKLYISKTNGLKNPLVINTVVLFVFQSF